MASSYDTGEAGEAALPMGRAEALALGLLLTLAMWELPGYWPLTPIVRATGLRGAAYPYVRDLVLIAVLLLPVLATRARSGLCIGRIREHWKWVLVLCAIPVAATLLVYPGLGNRPFHNRGADMWLTSPLRQDLFFAGYLYGLLDRAFPGRLHPRLPWDRAVVLGAGFFALYHLPNAYSLGWGYTLFQMAYTGIGYLISGLTRQWTGSMLYLWLAHVAVNFIAWAAR